MTKTAFSTRRPDAYGPPAEHRRLLAEEPVALLDWAEQGRDIWTVAKYEDVRAMLGNTQFSSDRSNPLHPAHMAYNPRSHPGRIIEMDPPKHATQRGRVMGEFTVKKIAAMRPRIEEIVNSLIDSMLAGEHQGDFVELLALPVPSMVIADLLNVPDEDYSFFQEKAGIFADGLEVMEKRQKASSDIVDYITKLVDICIETPGDDVLSRQIAAGAPREEAIGLGHLLLIAGHETTSNMISLAIMTLLDKPELRQQLVDQPALIPGAVEELLRYFTIAETGGLRLAVADIELSGVTIPSGSVVAALTNTANRDPEAFPDPDQIDFTRGARNHVAFGFGPHQCLGQNVARLELVVVLEILLKRLPNLELAVPVSELPLKEYSNFGLHKMPVTW